MRLNPLLHPRTYLHFAVARFRRWRQRHQQHLRPAQIREAFQSLADSAGDILLVHSSLSACGHIEGGVSTVLTSLRQWAGSGTLAMPTHTYCYPVHGRPAPCFDPVATGSIVGRITDAFWRQPGVVRSMHPTHSLACEGPLAQEICSDHEWSDTACGRGTPYEKLIRRDCAVLLFGTTFESYTLFHFAEHEAQVPYLYLPERCQLVYRDRASIEWRMSARRQDMRVRRRFAAMDAWLQARGLVKLTPMSLGELRFVPSALAMHEALMNELRRDSWFLTERAAA